jgi:phage terminase large subunit-like protein
LTHVETVHVLKRRGRPPNPKTDGERNIKWIEDFCRIPEGEFVGQKFKLAPFMRDDLLAIYDNKGRGRARRAIISRGRKNAKTTECAFIVLLHLVGREAKPNSNLYSAAQSRDQASLIFNLATKIVGMSPDLHPLVRVKETAKELHCPDLGTKFKALSAEASTAFGLNPALVVHDELGQVRGPRSALYEALETATAGQKTPLSIVISTQAPNDNDLLSILIDDAKAGHDPRTVLQFDAAPEDIDPFSLEAIKLANPAFDYFMNQEEVLAMAENARRMPAREAEYRNLVLNQRVEANNPFCTPALWKGCNEPVKDIHGVQVYAGLDLSSVADLTALVLIGKVDRVWQVHPTFWLPAEGLKDKSVRDRVPYDLWHQQGFLQTTPGNTVSYEYVAHHLRKLFAEYNIRKLAFDRWNFKHLKPWLLHAGFNEMAIEDKFVEFGQGSQSMSPALRDLEQVIMERELAHGDHPVLKMCVASAVVEGKDDANRRLSKNKSTGRIDGLVALAMAIGAAPHSTNIDISSLIA